VGVADKKTVVNIVYRNKQTGQPWAKRFIVDKFILEKTYRYFDGELEYFSTAPDDIVEIHLSVKGKVKIETLAFQDIPIQGAHTRGTRISNQKVKKVIGPEKRKKR
jgi:topoisomerase-4 subunit A